MPSFLINAPNTDQELFLCYRDLLYLGNVELRNQGLKGLIELSSGCPQAKEELGIFCMKAGELCIAERYFKSINGVQGLKSETSAYLYELAKLYEAKEDLDNFIRLLRDSAELGYKKSTDKLFNLYRKGISEPSIRFGVHRFLKKLSRNEENSLPAIKYYF